jgi:hypothetical protein
MSLIVISEVVCKNSENGMIGRLMFGMCAMAVVAMAHGSAIVQDTSSKDIAERAIEAGSLKTLAAALEAADSVETLQGKGPFTVFAVSNDQYGADAASCSGKRGTLHSRTGISCVLCLSQTGRVTTYQTRMARR